MLQTNGRVSDDPATSARLYWAAYVLDVEVSLACGIPRLIQDEDMDLPLPSPAVIEGNAEGDHSPPLASGSSVFALRAELATIQSRIRTQLYAARAFQSSDSALIDAVRGLASDLDTWRSSVPEDIQPGRHGQMSQSAMETPVIMLHLVYYNCVSMVHWAVHRHSEWGTGNAAASHQEQMEASGIRVRTAAKVVVQLLPRIRSKSVSDVWYVWSLD